MTPTPDLKRALALVAEADLPSPDPTDDLARAHRAARARTRRRFRAGLAGLAVTSILGVGAATVLADAESPSTEATQVAPEGVRLVAERFDAAPYSFDLTPTGWSVQGQSPTAVTIAPDDGSTSAHPDDFRGKLVIMFDANPPHGEAVDHEGRRFWIAESDGYTTIATHTRGDEPSGVVRIQYPHDAGWEHPSMLAFLASVHVGDGARWGLG
ncbi:hypothetical protein [Nocardioides ferulae]|uniref:hypothetical protein n=1 Tax=Nocardioides ferulae TaxID=2340821 RepID=UPI000EB5AB17|nr:hypothetical protein [Nocardioides ferulae]